MNEFLATSDDGSFYWSGNRECVFSSMACWMLSRRTSISGCAKWTYCLLADLRWERCGVSAVATYLYERKAECGMGYGSVGVRLFYDGAYIDILLLSAGREGYMYLCTVRTEV